MKEKGVDRMDGHLQIMEFIKKIPPYRKLELMAQAGPAYGYLPEYGISGTIPQDVPRGGADIVRSEKIQVRPDGCPADGEYHPVALMSTSAVGMSWDCDFAYRVGKLFAKEAKSNPQQVDMLNRPGMNLKRSPLCGRNYDYLSEDPVHTGKMAAAYIRGIQSEGIAACPKHFIANNQEFERMTSSSNMDERTFREVYLRAWEIALKEGKPKGVMTSYNKVNGEWVNSSKSCMDALRKDLKYDGFVVSDFLAIHENKVEAHRMGVDVELAPVEDHTQELIAAYQKGEITDTEIDRAVRHIMELYNWSRGTVHGDHIDMKQLHLKAREMAKECMTLLKNDGILPFSDFTGKILVAGELAEKPTVEGSGSGYMNGYFMDIPMEEVKKLGKERSIKVDYCKGYRMTETMPPSGNETDPDLINEFKYLAQSAECILLFAGSPYGWESEGYDRVNTQLPKNQQELIRTAQSLGKPVVLVLTGGSVWHLGNLKKEINAILYAGFTGEAFGGAVADIIFGIGEPGGRLAETFPLYEEQGPAYLDFGRFGKRAPITRYSEGIYCGYRWYDIRKLEVCFPFGHGLSYTDFSYRDIQCDCQTISKGENISLTLTLKNEGVRPGSQVLQLYVAKKGNCLQRPVKELKDFMKLHLQPKEEKRVKLTVSWEDLKVYDPETKSWFVESGDYELLLALSAKNILERFTVTVEGNTNLFRYDTWTALEWFVKDPEFHRYLEKKGYSDEFRTFFDSKQNELLILMYPLPIYRLTEPIPDGKDAMFTEKALRELIYFLNKKKEECSRQR